jgi:GTPase SAR1 family protein
MFVRNNPVYRLKVAMLGPSGVGKTTLLTVMSRELNKTAELSDLELITDEESEAILDKHYRSLEALVDNFAARGNEGIQGTQKPRDFLFTFGRRKWLGNRQALELEFLDIPGGYLADNITPERKKYYVDSVAKSGATIIVIDTLALMVRNGRFNEQRNQVGEVTRLMQAAYRDQNDPPKLVVFVPIKCETYLQENQSFQDINNTLRTSYGELLDFLRQRNVAIAITPVKTVGCVIYTGYEVDQQGRVMYWYLRKTTENAKMQPEYADLPLRYLLRFLIRQHLNAQQGGFLGAFNDLLQRNDDLKQAFRRFANVPQMNTPVKILQGEDLLSI